VIKTGSPTWKPAAIAASTLLTLPLNVSVVVAADRLPLPRSARRP